MPMPRSQLVSRTDVFAVRSGEEFGNGRFRYSIVAALVSIALVLEARAQLSELELVPNPASTLESVEARVRFSTRSNLSPRALPGIR